MYFLIAPTLTDFQSKLILAAVPIIGGGTLLGALINRLTDAMTRRRDRYSDAVKTLVAWIEFPYRIRRRISDTPEELGRLAGMGHDLQEQLQCHHTWIRTDSKWVGGVYQKVLTKIRSNAGPMASAAWGLPPVTDAASMVLNGWDASGFDDEIKTLQIAIATRFGWRRLLGPFQWSYLVVWWKLRS